MPVSVRVGAVHLGWDVVSVAAGGGGSPIRPVQVEGTYTPPAYLLADASGRLHTAGVDRQRPDLGMAIADVRDILGHPQIVVAGATWPAELVFRARMYNPLAGIGKYLRGKPDLVALPHPDDWPEEKVEVYCELVERLDVTAEPLPESVALSGYVRALNLVSAPDHQRPHGIGATGVYSDGRTMLVVAVHGDDEQPTESVDVPVSAEAMRDARSADNVVIEVMAAARSIGADTSTVLLAGNVCFNDPLRLAFQNHLGHRLQVADHPMHALVLGAAHLLVTDSDSGEPESSGRHAEPPRPVEPPPRPAESAHPPDASQRPPGPVARPLESPQHPPMSAAHPGAGAPVVTYGPGYPTSQHAPDPDERTTRMGRDELAQGLPPNLAEMGSRFTRPPGPATGEMPAGSVPPLGPRAPYQPPQPPPGGQWQGGTAPEPEDDRPRKGLRGKMKGKLFGAHTIIGAVALAAVALPSSHSGGVALAASAIDTGTRPIACALTPRVLGEPPSAIAPIRGNPTCVEPEIDTLRYRIPGGPGLIDPGPPIAI